MVTHILLFPGGGYEIATMPITHMMAGEIDDILDLMEEWGLLTEAQVNDPRVSAAIAKIKCAKYETPDDPWKRIDEWKRECSDRFDGCPNRLENHCCGGA